jgi:outer membrane receptor protein involved in Fe transport
MRGRSRTAAALIVALLFVFGQATRTLAGTTGSLSGTVLDASTNAPIGSAVVNATSPSQVARTSTDANGKFTFASLAPDTYSVSVEKAGFQTQSITGITVQADQTQTYTVSLPKALTEIGRVGARRGNDLIKPGTTVDVYSVTPAQQQAASALGGGGALNSAYSAIASVPGVFIPQGQKGVYQAVFVRGGNFTDLGFEYDGVPISRAFDAYPAQNLGTIGQQELQIYTGAAPANAGSNGLAGYVNQVVKSGTFPGSGNVTGGAGSPFYYRQLSAEYGGASPNRRFSYYGGFEGDNQTFVYERGREYTDRYGPPAYALAKDCGTPQQTGGCYNIFAPNSLELGPLFYNANGTTQFARENVLNFHYKIPHGDMQDDVQLLYNVQSVQSNFPETLADMGNLASDFLHGTATIDGVTYPRCTPALFGVTPCGVFEGAGGAFGGPNLGDGFHFRDKSVYGGPLGTALTAGDLGNTQLVLFPDSPAGRPINSLIPANMRPSYMQDAAIVKLQYQRNISPRAYLRLYGYTSYTDWLQYDPYNPAVGALLLFATASADYKLGSHTRGGALQFADQLNDKHLLNAQLQYTTASTIRNNNQGGLSLSTSTVAANTSTVAFLVSSADPTAGTCYVATGAGGVATPRNCASATTSRYVIPSTGAPALVRAHAGDPTVATASSFTCGGAPCEYFTVANGQAALVNTVQPKFTSLSLQDTWTPSDRLTFTLGLRYDDFKYGLSDTSGGAARQFWTNYNNAYTCYDPVAHKVVAGRPAANDCGTIGLQQLAFSAASGASNDYPELQPRLGFTYTVNPLNVIRFNAGKTAQPAPTSYQQYDALAANLFPGSFAAQFYPYGFTSPQHKVYPQESYTVDASWEHQVRGTDLSWKISPYFRQSKNALTTVQLDPVTNFSTALNAGTEFVKGVELAIRKGSLDRDGWYGQLAYTYTDANITFSRLPNGSTIVDPLNTTIRAYNAYTSFCASHQSDPRCVTGTAGGAPVSFTSGGAPAAPCYTQTGAPDPACGAGSLANPYWNAPVEGILDPGTRFNVYQRYATAAFFSGTNQSYVAPHVAALVLNYKHGPLSVTPSFQFQGGARYGAPLNTVGLDPAGGCGVLSSPIAGDPRYPYGAPGGQPYDAATCNAFQQIPNPFSKRFDNYGQYLEPNVITGNLGISYDLNKKTRVSLLGVNLLSSCFGGSRVPWAVSGRVGCNLGGISGTYVGNLYNPGDRLQTITQYPYIPNFTSAGNLQNNTGGQALYPQFFLTVQTKL